MMNRLINILKNKGLDGYFISETNTETYQLYFVKENVETIRAGEFKDYSVTIYVKHDNKLGDANFTVSSSFSDEEINEIVDNAKANALNIFNEPYELVKNEHAEFKGDIKSLKDIAENLKEAIFSVKGNSGAKLNATEIFVNKIDRHVVNSNGLDKKDCSYKFMIETIPTFDKEKESVEIYACKEFSDFTNEEIASYIKEKLYEVEARANATKIDLDKTLDVTIRSDEILSLLYEYVDNLNYATIYSKSNVINKGDNIQKGSGDRINLTMKNKVKGCSESSEFDRDGSSFKEIKLYENGEAINEFGGNRYSQYLKKECTGNLPIIELDLGSLTKEDLKDKTYLECLQFSGIQCDLLSDYIGGEVRLAILHKDDKEIPVCGFSISGKLSEVLNEIKFSNKIVSIPGYSGPSFALLKDLQIL